MTKIVALVLAASAVMTMSNIAHAAADTNDHSIVVKGIDPSRPWGIPTVEISGTGGVANIAIRDAGMTSFDPVDGINPKPDARFRDRKVWDVAFLSAGNVHPSLAGLQYCLQPINQDNEVIGAEVCSTPSPSMTFTMPVRPGTTRLLPVMRNRDNEKIAWGWQPERGTHPFEGWRAIVLTNSNGQVRNATEAEVRAFQ